MTAQEAPLFSVKACGDLTQRVEAESHEPATIHRDLQPHWNPAFFSDPRNHDPKKYRYIIRATRSKTAELALRELRGDLISASLIANDEVNAEKFIGVFEKASWALILEIPESQVVVAVPRDTGRISRSTDEVNVERLAPKYQRAYGFQTPDLMIRKSIEWAERPDMGVPYNELIFKGSEKVRVTGIAYFPANRHLDLDLETIERLSSSLNVPVVRIE